MKEIILSNGSRSMVDDIDYEYLNQFDWHPLAGSKTTYAVRGMREKGIYEKILMHRVIAERMDLNIFGFEIDHRSNDGLNNQRYNLFSVTRSVNQQNATLRHDSSSGIRGVNYNELEGKWKARIQVGKTRLCLGTFTKFEDAVAARLRAEERYYTWRGNEPQIGVSFCN